MRLAGHFQASRRINRASYNMDLDEMADVIQSFQCFDIEAGIGWYIESLATFISRPSFFTLDADAAFTSVQFHNFCRAGIEYQARRENHAYGFFAAVGKQDGMRNAFAIEIDIGLLDDANLVELCSHDESE